MKCLNCGTEIQEGAQFCYNCRAPQSREGHDHHRKTTEGFRTHWAVMTIILSVVLIIVFLIVW